MLPSLIPKFSRLPFFSSSSKSSSSSPSSTVNLPPLPTHSQPRPVCDSAAGAATSSSSFPSTSSIPASYSSSEVPISTVKAHRRLHQLLRLNHANHAVLSQPPQQSGRVISHHHNRIPHILGSGYVLGNHSHDIDGGRSPYTADQLTSLYESQCCLAGSPAEKGEPAAAGLAPWHTSPGEVSKEDWRDYVGHGEYERAFLDFFGDLLVEEGYDWYQVVREVLLSTDEDGGGGDGGMLIDSIILSESGHAIVHLAWAFELGSREVALEALTLAATTAVNVSDDGITLAKYLREQAPASSLGESHMGTKDPLEILARARKDTRLEGDGHFSSQVASGDLTGMLECYRDVLLEYMRMWDLSSKLLTEQFELSQRAAATLLTWTSTSKDNASMKSKPSFNADDHGPESQEPSDPNSHQHPPVFPLLHPLLTSHALRVILPHIRQPHQTPLLRQWLLQTLCLYVVYLQSSSSSSSSGKFAVDIESSGQGDEHAGIQRDNNIEDKPGWGWIVERTLHGPYKNDPAAVAAVRGLVCAWQTWRAGGDDQDGSCVFLDAAVRVLQ